MKTRPILIAAGLAAVLLASCAPAAAPAPALAPSSRSDAAPASPTSAARPASGGTDAAKDANPVTDRLVIRNARLTLVVKDTQASLDDIGRLTAESKGFIQTSSTTKVGSGLRASVVLKIPAERLDGVLANLRKMAVDVTADEVTGQDVTAEYVDLQARIKNLEAAETQLRALLEKATKTDDVLAIHRELTNYRGQIEQAKGRSEFLVASAAMSTVSLTLVPDSIAQPIQPTGWRPEGDLKRAFESLINTLQGLISALIWFAVAVLPVLLLIGVPIYVIARILRARAKARPARVTAKAATPPTPPTP